ncbi:MAG: sigma-70 family RNA polymerase sigma factor [Gemmatimonadota bacterium]|nr:sigma-70 family RNA polymerase sigma factor [Gemmatimonadota bacterium]
MLNRVVEAPDPPPESENGFASRFRAGDAALFRELINRYDPLVRQAFHRRGRQWIDLDDLVQEAWLRAWRLRSSFRGTGASPEAQFAVWLRRVCQSVSCAITPLLDEIAPTTELSDVGDGGAQAEMCAAIADVGLAHRLLEQLPRRQQAIVRARLLDDLSTAEVALALGCREGTVKSALHAALRRLRQSLV